jgi:uncharacterized protein GlcG (DUF336 family)
MIARHMNPRTGETPMTPITLDQARTMIAATVAAGQAAGMKPLSVVVLDAGGHPIAFERADGSSPGRFQIAHAKAHGAVMLGVAGRAQFTMAEARPQFIGALNGVFGGQFLPVPGGVLLRDGQGHVVGALGVTGDTSDNDAEAALAGAAAVGLTGEA